MYVMTLLTMVVLAVTGFLPTLVGQNRMQGFVLLLHSMIAPWFMAGLAGLAVAYGGLACRSADKMTVSNGLVTSSFWALVAVALVVILSAIVSLLPLFGTTGMARLAEIHHYSSLFLLVATGFHLYNIRGTDRFSDSRTCDDARETKLP